MVSRVLILYCLYTEETFVSLWTEHDFEHSKPVCTLNRGRLNTHTINTFAVRFVFNSYFMYVLLLNYVVFTISIIGRGFIFYLKKSIKRIELCRIENWFQNPDGLLETVRGTNLSWPFMHLINSVVVGYLFFFVSYSNIYYVVCFLILLFMGIRTETISSYFQHKSKVSYRVFVFFSPDDVQGISMLRAHGKT